MRHARAVAPCALFWCALCASAAAPPPPRIDSVYPVGGKPGSTFQAVVRGANLKHAYQIWFEGGGMQGTVLGVEQEVTSGARGKVTTDLLRIEMKLDASMPPGSRSFRVLTSGGISNALPVHAHEEPPLLEADGPHDLPRQAQVIVNIPVALHGRIAQSGEVDYYSFRVDAGQELTFRTVSSAALDPGLALYKLTGSYFDPDRATRLAFTDEPVSYPDLTTEATLYYRFAQAGQYLVRVNGFWGHGGPGQEYALLISPTRPHAPPADEDRPAWRERSWTRPLDTERMRQLWNRAVPRHAPALPPIPVIDADAEPATAPVEPPVIPLPALVTGTIERPGDIDRVRFSVKEGDRIVIEVETPEKTLPLMNPYLRVVDSEGVEAFTNVLSNINANGNVSKQIHPKTQYSFPRAGQLTLEIRDITATYGDRQMRYKVLVRPQVPHVGAIQISEDRLNLVAGKTQKLSIVTDQEEGFDGFVILSMEGLPEGVRAVTATEVEPDRPPSQSVGKRERFTTKNQKATFVLIPGENAPATKTPAMARIYAQPSLKGDLGTKMLIKEIPVMVIGEEPPGRQSE